MFRLQDKYRPTIIIDEAECLGDRRGHSELIQLMNDGWTKGGLITRCVGDEHEIQFFDAFGFRAIAAIGKMADTILSRSIPIRMQRAPKGARVARLNRRAYQQEASAVARRILRWAHDNMDAVVEAERTAHRPDWLGDRDCDNWAILFAIGEVASNHWRERLLHAAKTINAAEVDADWTEEVVHDVRRVFAERDWPDVIMSGDLVKALNGLPDARWIDMRRGQGVSANRLVTLLRPFDVRPTQARDKTQGRVRGYWLADLRPVFDRYPPVGPGEVGHVGQVGQPNNHAGSGTPPSGTLSHSEVGQS